MNALSVANAGTRWPALWGKNAMAKKWLKLEKRVRALEEAIAKFMAGGKSATKKTMRKKTKKKLKKTPPKTPMKAKGERKTKTRKASMSIAPRTRTKAPRKVKNAQAKPNGVANEAPAGDTLLAL